MLVELLLQLSFTTLLAKASLIESERVAEYHARNYTWPPTKFVPNTPGWTKLMQRRIQQVSRVQNDRDRYNGYLTVINSGLIAPNFTEHGWGLTKAPESLVEELKQSLHYGLQREDLPLEEFEEAIGGCTDENRPLFVEQKELNKKALHELKYIHEDWSGVSLVPELAYGLRVYRNESFLNMHIDKLETHVISSILHVDHSANSQPWPLVIEDFQGNTNEVVLESGDMLLYESSKCLHGRPRPFHGSWYASLFMHYYPTTWDGPAMEMETHYAVPPSWFPVTTVASAGFTSEKLSDGDVKTSNTYNEDNSNDEKEDLENFEIISTSIKEPRCPHAWCALKDSIKWRGPAIANTVMSTGSERHTGEDEEGKGKGLAKEQVFSNVENKGQMQEGAQIQMDQKESLEQNHEQDGGSNNVRETERYVKDKQNKRSCSSDGSGEQCESRTIS